MAVSVVVEQILKIGDSRLSEEIDPVIFVMDLLESVERQGCSRDEVLALKASLAVLYGRAGNWERFREILGELSGDPEHICLALAEAAGDAERLFRKAGDSSVIKVIIEVGTETISGIEGDWPERAPDVVEFIQENLPLLVGLEGDKSRKFIESMSDGYLQVLGKTCKSLGTEIIEGPKVDEGVIDSKLGVIAQELRIFARGLSSLKNISPLECADLYEKLDLLISDIPQWFKRNLQVYENEAMEMGAEYPKDAGYSNLLYQFQDILGVLLEISYEYVAKGKEEKAIWILKSLTQMLPRENFELILDEEMIRGVSTEVGLLLECLTVGGLNGASESFQRWDLDSERDYEKVVKESLIGYGLLYHFTQVGAFLRAHGALQQNQEKKTDEIPIEGKRLIGESDLSKRILARAENYLHKSEVRALLETQETQESRLSLELASAAELSLSVGMMKRILGDVDSATHYEEDFYRLAEFILSKYGASPVEDETEVIDPCESFLDCMDAMIVADDISGAKRLADIFYNKVIMSYSPISLDDVFMKSQENLMPDDFDSESQRVDDDLRFEQLQDYEYELKERFMILCARAGLFRYAHELLNELVLRYAPNEDAKLELAFTFVRSLDGRSS